jgi:hypothetical protein
MTWFFFRSRLQPLNRLNAAMEVPAQSLAATSQEARLHYLDENGRW